MKSKTSREALDNMIYEANVMEWEYKCSGHVHEVAPVLRALKKLWEAGKKVRPNILATFFDKLQETGVWGEDASTEVQDDLRAFAAALEELEK